jgi:type II secretory pathway pseudopilin PulG
MRRLLLMAVIGALAYAAVRWALRQSQVARDEAAKSNWENEGGATGPPDV